MKRITALLLCLWSLAATPALAWSEYSHNTIGAIAQTNVSPQTRAEISRLFAAEALLGTPECRLRNMADASTWPDCIRRDRVRYAYTAPWHYQNVNICKPFETRSSCANGNCVSAQIDRNAALLKDRNLPRHVRLEALANLVHFVGDLHQPLHAGDRNDRGGNDLDVHWGIVAGKDLHGIWDNALAERSVSADPLIVRRYGQEERTAMNGGNVADWSRESWQLSRDLAYARALDGDPCSPKALANPPATPLVIDEADVAASEALVRLQVVRAGLRLARLLDEALATP